jgi:NADH:ubiquinone oxidoreductase subunit E
MTTGQPSDPLAVIAEWSDANRRRAADVLEAYPERRSALMPLLYLAMMEHGHVTEEAMQEVATLTGLTPAQVLSVASFYTMYKREDPGRYLISVCTSTSCHLLGSDEVLDAIIDETGTADGETSEDGLFGVEHIECNGACGGAPVVLVNYEMVEGVTPEKAKALCRWLRDGRPEVVLADEMQQLFGGRRSFDWGISEEEGAIRPVPAFDRYGSSGEES